MNLSFVLILVFIFVVAGISSYVVKKGVSPGILELVIILAGFTFALPFLGIVDSSIIAEMEPLFLMAFAWIGILVGLQLNWKILKRFSPFFYLFTVSEYFVSSFFVIAGLLLLRRWNSIPELSMFTILTIGIVSSVSSPFYIFSASGREKIYDYVKFAGSMDGVLGILLFQILFLLKMPITIYSSGNFTLSQYTLFVFSISLLVGLLFYWSTSLRLKRHEYTLLAIGFALVTGGSAGINLFSPAFTGLMVGLILANLSSRNFILNNVFSAGERPVFFLFLFVAGMVLNFSGDFLHPFLSSLVVVVFRLGGKLLTSGIFLRIAGFRKNLLDVSSLLLPEGGIALILAANYLLFFPDRNSYFLFSMIVMTYVLNQLLAIYLNRGIRVRI